MNYLGHAYLAELERPDPIFILGAMLPDLTSLAQVRTRQCSRGDLALGIQFHHGSDQAFHQHEAFRTGQLRLTRELVEQGVRKGPARAIAHIGIEFLLDAGYDDPAHGYFEALEVGARLLGVFSAFDLAEQRRLHEVCAYLRSRGREPFQVTRARLSQKLERTLAGRSRLSPTEGELAHAASKLCEAAPFWFERSTELARSVLDRVQATNWQTAPRSSNLGRSA
jgi:hypothetical protein